MFLQFASINSWSAEYNFSIININVTQSVAIVSILKMIKVRKGILSH